MKNCINICLSVLFAVLAVTLCRGQGEPGEIQITRPVSELGNTKPVPVSIEGFGPEVTEILKFDLYVQGFAPNQLTYLCHNTLCPSRTRSDPDFADLATVNRLMRT